MNIDAYLHCGFPDCRVCRTIERHVRPCPLSDFKELPRPNYTDHWQAGVIFRLESFWVGIHWSKTNRRLCVNLLPCLTFYLTLPGGDVPKIADYPHRWALRK